MHGELYAGPVALGVRVQGGAIHPTGEGLSRYHRPKIACLGNIMIGIWSEHAGAFLLLVAGVTAVCFSFPLFIAPLRWARLLGWTIPAHADLAVYFGRCLGAVAIVLNAVQLRAGITGESATLIFQITLGIALLMVIVHAWGAIRRIQPVSETIEIAFWAGIALLTLAFWP